MELKTLEGNELPEVFEFLYQLGIRGSQDLGSSKWFVITLPNLAYAAQLIGLGALSNLVQSKWLAQRVGPENLEVGGLVTWLTADKLHVKCGTFLGIANGASRGDRFQLQPMADTSQTFRLIEKFDEYKFSPYFGSPFKHERKLSANPEIISHFAGENWLDMTTQSRSDICFVGEPRLSAELRTPSFTVGGVSGCGDDILRVENLFDVGESPHYLSRFIKTMSPKFQDPLSQIAIFDGAASFQRHGNYVSAKSKFILLNRWDNNSSDVAIKLSKIHAKSRPRPLTLGKLKIPRGIEIMAWSPNVS